MFANRAERPDPDRGIASFLYTMYRGGMITKPKIKLTPAEDNLWYKFWQKSILLDSGYKKDQGWHWFWGIYEVYKNNPQSVVMGVPIINLSEIKKSIPDDHWLNSTPSSSSSSSGSGKPDISLKQESASILQSLLLEHGYSKLPQEIDFSKLIFKNGVTFSNFIFPLSVSFTFSEFPYDVRFNEAFFYRSVDFIVTEFSSSSSFNNAKFLSNVNFGKATFSSGTSFDNVTFSNDATFNGVDFSKSAFFTRVKFLRAANFHETNFFDIADFSNAIFSIMANFDSATFAYVARFYEVKITGHTTFKYAKFKQYPPSFHKADMYSDIMWDESRWPILSKESNTIVVGQNKNSYENLASLMKKLDKYHDEHFFYRKEMQCRGRLADNPFVRFAHLVYETLANFGYGLERAFFWWVLHIFAGIVFITATTKSDYCALRGSFANAHGFLFFHKGPLKGCYEYFEKYDIFDVIWGVQTVFGILFLFLLLLTVRIRFRLK